MQPLVTHARIPLSFPDRILAPLCEHLAEHGAEIDRRGKATIVRMGMQSASLKVDDGCLLAEVEARSLDGLQELKQVLASHVIEFAGPDSPRIVWLGDGADLVAPPDFRMMTVLDAVYVTPHMRRIKLSGENLGRFDNQEALHVRMFLPEPGAEPEWPTLGENGLLRPSDRPLPVRKYTIRRIDVSRGEVEIDFFLHEDGGPGSSFARRAQPGDRIGMAGPGGRGLKTADWYLFMGDETGLPAIGRMLEMLPPAAKGQVLIEIADSAEEQPLRVPNGIELRWLHRNGAMPGESTLLVDALHAIHWPAGNERIYFWAAMEHAAFKEARTIARTKLQPNRDEHLVVSYWRRD